MRPHGRGWVPFGAYLESILGCFQVAFCQMFIACRRYWANVWIDFCSAFVSFLGRFCYCFFVLSVPHGQVYIYPEPTAAGDGQLLAFLLMVIPLPNFRALVWPPSLIDRFFVCVFD